MITFCDHHRALFLFSHELSYSPPSRPLSAHPFVHPTYIRKRYHSSIHRRTDQTYPDIPHQHPVVKRPRPVPSRKRKRRHRHSQQSVSSSSQFRVAVLRLPHKQLSRQSHKRRKMLAVHLRIRLSPKSNHGLERITAPSVRAVRLRDLAERRKPMRIQC